MGHHKVSGEADDENHGEYKPDLPRATKEEHMNYPLRSDDRMGTRKGNASSSVAPPGRHLEKWAETPYPG